MSGGNTKKIGTKILAWILIGAMLLTFVFAIIVVLIQQFSMGVEMKDIDDDLLNKLKMLPGFESDGNGNYTLEGHPLIISKIVVAE